MQNDLRGRRHPPTERQIMNRALSFKMYGQIVPCEVRIQTIGGVKGVPVLNSGFTRCAAARLLRKGFTIPEDWADTELTKEDAEAKVEVFRPGQFIQDPSFVLRVVSVNCNDENAFLRNLIENLERNDCTDIDDAHNQERLRRNYGYSDADIARFYKYANQSRVTRLKQLLQLPDHIQDMVHYGSLPTTAALDLLSRPREEWDAILSMATCEGGKVKGQVVRAAVRDNTLADANNATELHEVVASTRAAAANEATGETSGPATKPRSLAELRKFIDQRVSGGKGQLWQLDPAIEKCLKSLRSWLGGKITDQALQNAFIRLLEAELTGVEDDGKEAA
jgi:ParB-like chromosome segregation protein Spo0J